MTRKKTIAVDFDRTLCVRVSGQSIWILGEPITPMVNRVKKWIDEGKKVVIFTARHPKQYPILKKWLVENGLPKLEITNVKSPNMDEFWDDKAVGVLENTGTQRDGGICEYVCDLIHDDIFLQVGRGNFIVLENLCKKALNYPSSIQFIILNATSSCKDRIKNRKELLDEYKFRNRNEEDDVWKGLE